MANQFDATARISLDLRAFAAGANQVTQAGGAMEKVFKNLHGALSAIGIVEKKQAADLARSLRIYNQITATVRGYVSMVNALAKAEQSGANATAKMGKAFDAMKASLAAVRGIGEKEFQRVQRTLVLYERMANVMKTLSMAQNQATQTSQRAAAATAAEAKEADRARLAITNQAIAEQRLAAATARAAAAQQAATTATARGASQAAQSVSRLAQAQAQAAAASARATAAANAAASAQVRSAAQIATAQARAAQAAAQAAIAQQRLANVQRQSASAQAASAQAMRRTSESGNLLRQDLSELTTMYNRMSQVAVSSVQAVVHAAISHEAAFAQLARVTKVTGQESENLKAAFEGLATTEPISFEDVARVGQLAAQTGIATQQLEEFSRTVIRFSVTTGIASDQVTVLFGRIQNMQDLPTSQMNRFASMVLAVGTASAATEDEILKVTQAISTSSKMFGLTTQDIGGLAGALASLRVPPEWSRGTTTRIFRELDDAVKSAGAELGIISDVMGLTTEEIRELRASDPGKFFRDFIQGMSRFTDTTKSAEEGTASVANVLRSLGVSAVRDIEFISRLASNFDTLSSQTDIATVAFQKNSELTEQTAILYDTARVKIDNMIDAFQTFLSGVGKNIVVVLGDAANAVSSMIQAFREVPASIKVLATGTVLVLGFVAALTALRAAAFLGLRSMVAMRETQARLGVQTLSLTNLTRAYRDQVRGAGAANTQAATGIRAQVSAAREQAATARASTAALNEQARQATINAVNQQRLSLRGMQLARAELQAIGQRAAAGRSLADDTNRQIAAQQRLASSTARYTAATQQAVAGTQRLGTIGTVATTGLTARMSALAVTTRATAGAVGLLGAAFSAIAIGAIITGIFTLIEAMKETASVSKQAADAAFEASGGVLALGEAIRQDTIAAQNGETPMRRLAVAANDLSKADREAAIAKRDAAKAEQERLTALFGSIDALRRTAKGTDSAAKSAREFVLEYDAAQKIIDQVNTALGENSVAIGRQTQAMLENTVRQAVMTDEAFKTKAGLDAISDSSLAVQKAMSLALKEPANAAQILQDEIDKLNTKFSDVMTGNDTGQSTEQFASRIKQFQEQKRALETLRDTLGVVTGNVNQAAAADILFGKSAKQAGADAEEMSEGLDGAADSASALSEDISAMTTAMSSALDPARSLEAAFKALDFKNSADYAAAFRAGKISIEDMHKSFKAFTESIRDQLTVTRDWSKNLVRAVNELSPEVANAFRDMGIEAAPLLAEALTLKGEERNKFIAEMTAFGKSGQEAFAAAITKGQDAIKGSGTETGKLFADATANAIDQAMKPGGSVQASVKALEGLGDLISKGAITKEIAIDLTKFQSDAKKLEEIALAMVRSGALDVKGAAQLVTSLYTGDAKELSDWVTAQNNVGAFDLNGDAKLDTAEWAAAVARLEATTAVINDEGRLDLEGKGTLTDEQYKAKLAELTSLVTLTVGTGILDPKGAAQLSPDQFITTMNALETLAKANGDAGKFDANGDGKLDPTEYTRILNFLKTLAQSDATKKGLSPTGTPKINPVPYGQGLGALTEQGRKWREQTDKYLRPSPSVNQSRYNTDLSNMKSNAYYTGQAISRNLSTSATVSVGYYYYQKNSPPKTQQIATGGWVTGPGGPREDKVPAMLSDGEYVINAKQASRFGAILEAINSGSYGKGTKNYAQGGRVNVKQVNLRSFANGGMVQRMPSQSLVPRIITPSSPMAITVNNQYPQAEPTSTTINRSLAYAATIGGV